MGRTPSCSKEGLNRGAWTEVEDRILKDHVIAHGEGKWSTIPQKAGLNRCGKSCRLRWLNYLRPDIKRGNISEDEEELIIRMHRLLGNRWSLIAGRLPGRTDNEIKNYWNTIAAKKVKGRQPASTPTSSKRSKPRPSTDQQPKTDAQPGSTIEHLEPDDDDEKLDVQVGIAAGTSSTVGKDPGPGDFELDDRFLSSFLDLDRDIKGEDNGCGGLGGPVDDGKVTSRASSSLNSEEEALMMSPELMLNESDLQCIASFLQEGESELLQ